MPTIVDVLSPERFETYRQWALGNDALGVQLYSYNVQLSTALYGPLHMLEIALRNVSDRTLISAVGVDWIDDLAILASAYQRRCVADARAQLRREGKAANHSQMIAELNFGFWTSLFGREANHLWRVLRPMFQARGIQRGVIAAQLRDLRHLRNRIAHYEPILALPLAQRYASITTLTGYLSPSAAAWIHQHSSWQALYPAVPILIPDAKTGELCVAETALPFLPQ